MVDITNGYGDDLPIEWKGDCFDPCSENEGGKCMSNEPCKYNAGITEKFILGELKEEALNYEI